MSQHVHMNEDKDEVMFVKEATNKGITKMKSQNTWSHYLDNTHNQSLNKVNTIAEKMKSRLWGMNDFQNEKKLSVI